MIKKPVTRMLGIKDKIINVPITMKAIKETVESLPRTLEEASVVPLAVKRKKEYKSYVYQQYIRPEYIRKAAKYLQAKYPFMKGSALTLQNLRI